MGSLFDETVGRPGSSVRIREETEGGKIILLAAEDPEVSGYSYRENLGFSIRDDDGTILPGAKKKALKIASEKSLLRVQGEKLADVTGEDDEAPEDRTLATIFDRFRTEELPHCGGETRQTEMERSLKLWEEWLGANFILADFAQGDWRRFIRERMSGRIDHQGKPVRTKKKRREVSPATVRHDLGALRQVCLWAKDERVGPREFLLPFDPTRGCDMPELRSSHRELYDDEETEALAKVAHKVTWNHKKEDERAPFYEAFVIARDLGRRIGSIVALRWSDWYPEEGSYGVLRFRSEHDKVGKESFTPVTPEIREALDQWRQENPGIGESWIFPAPKSDGHVRVDVAGDWLRGAEVLAGVEHVKHRLWHGLRRRWATKRKHLSLKDVAAAGGWKTTQVLEQHYQQEDMDTMEEVVMGGDSPLRRRRNG